MFATADFMAYKTKVLEPVQMADGGRMIVRGVQRLFGSALLLAAIGIWLIPASAQHDVMLFRLLLSVAAVVAGLGMMLGSSRPNPPLIQIDVIRREISLVRMGRHGDRTVLHKYGFADLSRAQVRGAGVRLWDHENRLLAEVNLARGPVLSSLIAGLQDAGKLA